MGTLTGVFDLSEGLEAVERVGVFDRASCAAVRAGGTMIDPVYSRRKHSSMTVRYLVRKDTYMKKSTIGR